MTTAQSNAWRAEWRPYPVAISTSWLRPLDELAGGRGRVEAGVGDGGVEDDATVAEPHGIDAAGSDIESQNPH